MGSAAFQIYSKCRSSSWTRRCRSAKAFTTWSNQKPTHTKRKTGRFHINLEQFAKQEDSVPKKFRTKPGAVLAKQEDSTSTWSNSQNRKIPHQEDSAPNLVQYSQNRKIPHQKDSAPNLVQYSRNRKIPHQPGAIRKTGRFHTKKIPQQTWYSTREL